MIGRALQAYQHVRLALQALDEGLDEARLADAGLTGDDDELPLALARRSPTIAQEFQLGRTPDQRREAAAKMRHEAALDLRFAGHLNERCGLQEAFQ